MKSTGRHHKPVNNELAQWLGEHIQEWKPHLPVIGVIAGIVVVAAITYLVFFSGDDNSSASSWQAYYAAYGGTNVENELKAVAEKQKGTAAGRWAALAVADQQLRQATQELAQNPKAAKTKLKNAEATLKEAETGASDKALLMRIHTSLAKASESANKLDDARTYYEKVAKADPDGTFGKSALKALKRLDKGSDVPEMLAWLDTQELESRPKATGGGFDGFGQRREPLPERPDLSIPGEMKLDGPAPRSSLGPSPLDPPLDLKGLPGFDKPGLEKPGETPKSETPKTETPDEDTKSKSPAVPKPVKPAVPTPVKPAEKPAEEKPAADEKAEEKKPPEEKPAEEKPATVREPEEKKPE